MTKKTISELPDGKDTQTSAAIVAFEEGGETFNGPFRPNPVNQINVRNQAQLEAELDVNLEIPDFTNVTIFVDDSFTLTTPIKVGNGAGLEIVFSNIGSAITWTGTGAMIQNIVPGVDESFFLVLTNTNVNGDTTNSLVDIKVASTGFTVITGLNLSSLGSIGTINGSVTSINSLSAFGITQGLVLVNVSQITVNNLIVGNFAATNTTWISILTNGPSLVTLSDLSASNGVADGDRLVFLDPNAAASTSFSVRSSGITDTVGAGEFYQLGTDIAIDSVTNNGGIAQFVTTPANELEIGTPVVISGYTINTDYNNTFVVTATPTAMTFEVGVAFGSDEAGGNMNTSSLDSTDPIVFAVGNRNSPDSHIISESRTNGILEVDGSGGIAVPIVDITPVVGDYIEDPTTERFSVDTSTGLVTYNGKNPTTVNIKYSLGAFQTVNPAQLVEFHLHINAIVQTKSLVTIVTTGIGVAIKGEYDGGYFTINPGDTFQLFKENISTTDNTSITNGTLLINEV